MKKRYFLIFALLIYSLALIATPLTHQMTPEEAKIKDFNKDFYETDPPVGDVRNIAEFDKMEGVLVRYPFGIPVSLIAEMSQDVIVTTLVANSSQQNSVLNTYNSNDVNTDNCNFLIAPSDSYWCRDFGPWYIADSQNNIAIVNFPYNRPRPNDNDVPIAMANFLDIDLYGMNVTHTGGNYMTDGLGASASSQLVWDENPSLTHEQINQRMHDYLGIDTYHVVQDPNNTYIDHIDCWGKYLAPDKVLIRSVPESHPQYDEIEETAAYFASHESSYGTLYHVYRVYTPNNQPYTNSLILNNKVFVPLVSSSYDDDAIASYQEAMPGYTIIGILSGSAPAWESTDALHCRTKGIADRNTLYIKHTPIAGNMPVGEDYEVIADIIPYSGQAVYADSLIVYYKVNNGEYSAITMTHESDYTYLATIPVQAEGAEIAYYIHAADQSGESANHPFIGAPDAHIFYAGQPVPPNLEVNPQSFTVNLNSNESTTQTLSLSNTGGGTIEYNISVAETDAGNKSIDGSSMTFDISEFYAGQNYGMEIYVTNGSTDNEWLTAVSLEFPNGVTVLSSSDLEGGTNPLVTDNSTGNGVTINWIDENGGYGNIHGGETAHAMIHFMTDSFFSEDIVLNYTMDGDIYGDEPHHIEGNYTITNLGEAIIWIALDQISGDLNANETDNINLTFDTIGLDYGTYTCDIIITYSDNEQMIVPVTLNVENVSNDENVISTNDSVIAYPNPLTNKQKSFLTIRHPDDVTAIKIYNIKGQLISNIKVSSKNTSSVWNLKDSYSKQVPSGIYLYKIIRHSNSSIGKIIILK